MRPQMLSNDVCPRLHLPREVRQPERIAPAENRREAGPASAFRSSRRSWFQGLSGGLSGGLPGPLGRSEPERLRDPLLTLVHRVSYGFDLEEYQRAKRLGFEGYLEEQLDPQSIDDSAADALLARFPVLGMSPKQVYDTYTDRTRLPYTDFKATLVMRAVHSRRQLLERMSEFWIDHFNIDHNKGLEWALLPEHERTVIRPHALGSFPELLAATAFSGAMLFYLDNWLNVTGSVQKNYARELMELHTLGVHGGYTETDVDEVARCFTGWTLEGDYASPDYLRGRYEPSYHEGGSKHVLGVTIPANPGRQNAQRVLDILVRHRSTSEFLARKLIHRFVTPEPSRELVERIAGTFQETNGDIKAVLRKLLTRENLSPPVVGPKYRRPFHLVASVLRFLHVRVRDGVGVLNDLVSMGHSPYDYEPPTGYPDDFSDWGATLLPRWTYVTRQLRPDFIFSGMTRPDPEDVRARLEVAGPEDRPGLAQRINQRFLGQALSRHEEQVLQRFIDDYPREFGDLALYDCIGLATTLPGFQWY